MITIVGVLGVTSAAHAEKWRELLAGKSTAVLVSSNEDQVAVLHYTQSVMYDEQVVALACPAEGRDKLSMDVCERFLIKVHEGPTDPTAGDRFDQLIEDHGFQLVKLRRPRSGAARIGKLTVTRSGMTITVRRGKKKLAAHEFETCFDDLSIYGDTCDEEKRVPKLTKVGVTPNGNVVAVFDDWWIGIVPVAAP